MPWKHGILPQVDSVVLYWCSDSERCFKVLFAQKKKRMQTYKHMEYYML